MSRGFPIGVIGAGVLIFLTAQGFLKSMFSPVNPGAFPAIIGAGLAISGVILLLQSFGASQKSGYPAAASGSDRGSEFVNGMVLLAILAVLAATFNHAGFLIAGGVAASLLAYLQSRRVVVSILTGAGIAGIVYVIFRLLLSVPLP